MCIDTYFCHAFFVALHSKELPGAGPAGAMMKGREEP